MRRQVRRIQHQGSACGGSAWAHAWEGARTGRLAAPSLGHADQVAPREGDRDGLLLDRGGLGVAVGGDVAHERGVKAKVGERDPRPRDVGAVDVQVQLAPQARHLLRRQRGNVGVLLVKVFLDRNVLDPGVVDRRQRLDGLAHDRRLVALGRLGRARRRVHL